MWTLINNRNNAHDCKLKNIVKENTLLHSDALSTHPTFFHHNGNSTSQIDYILSSGSFINKTNILRQHATNTSTHVPVVAELCRCLSTSIQKSRIKESRYKFYGIRLTKINIRRSLNNYFQHMQKQDHNQM